jgi:hypothetical protein
VGKSCRADLRKDSFHYGKFGGFTLVIDKNTGCFNATKLCKDGNKRFRKWKSLERAQELISFYEVKSCRPDLGGSFYEVKDNHENKIKTNIGQSEVQGFYEIRKQNNDVINKQITGQYVQKEFILDIASWISPDFYFKCSSIVNDYFIGQFKKQLEEERKLREETSEQLKQEKQRAEDAEEHILLLKDLLIDDQKRDKTQLIYIATSQSYAKQNRFKVGGVESVDKLSSRFSTYNSRSATGDEWYYSDTFLVSDYRQIESRLKDLMGRFRDKKSKEIYIVHYNNIKYVVDYLCKHYSDEVDEVNARLTEFISNLNTRVLRPIVPPPSQAAFANITTLKNGNATNVLLQASTQQDFTEQLKNYISKLDGTTTTITKKKVFDDLKVTKDRTSKFHILKEMFGQLRPEMIVKHKKSG